MLLKIYKERKILGSWMVFTKKNVKTPFFCWGLNIDFKMSRFSCNFKPLPLFRCTFIWSKNYVSKLFSEIIQIHCKCPGVETKKKAFLLDNGRLQYEIVKSAFQLTTLEIFIGKFCFIDTTCNVLFCKLY